MTEGLQLFLHLLAGVAAGYGLWRVWRILAADEGSRVTLLLAAGFLARALGGAALFWISYLGLDVARGLQEGRGLWFYALDGGPYLQFASEAAAAGPGAIARINPTTPSIVFVRALSILMLLAGGGAGVALLLNCGSFLLSSLVVKRWRNVLGQRASGPAQFGLVILALTPSWVLWSTQPLRDAFFVALVVACFWQSARWVSSWRKANATPWCGLGPFLALGVFLCGVAGIRTYFALMLWLGLGASVVLGAIREPLKGHLARFGKQAVLWVLLSQFIVLSGEPYLRGPAKWLSIRSWGTVWTGGSALKIAQGARQGFVLSGGATAIQPWGSVWQAEGSVWRAEDSVRQAEVRRGDWPKQTFVGLAALCLPRFVGEALGLFRIGGGRGFWAFAEIDTLFFLAAAIVSGVLTARAIRRSGRLSPVALHVLVTLLLVTAGLSYVVTNFGTLFRLREMVLVCFAVLPLAATEPTDPQVDDEGSSS